jgi:hypothetical protein
MANSTFVIYIHQIRSMTWTQLNTELIGIRSGTAGKDSSNECKARFEIFDCLKESLADLMLVLRRVVSVLNQ